MADILATLPIQSFSTFYLSSEKGRSMGLVMRQLSTRAYQEIASTGSSRNVSLPQNWDLHVQPIL